MNDIGRMHKEKSSENLVDKILNVVVRQVLTRVNDSMKVCFHQLGNYVDVSVASAGFGFEQVNEAYDILVFEEFLFNVKST